MANGTGCRSARGSYWMMPGLAGLAIVLCNHGHAMITLHIYLQVTPAREAELAQLYRDEYTPAISRQPGFRSTALLRTYDTARAEAIDARRDWTHEIDIVFDTEEDRQTWAAGPEHARVWPRVESLCERITWQGFDILA